MSGLLPRKRINPPRIPARGRGGISGSRREAGHRKRAPGRAPPALRWTLARAVRTIARGFADRFVGDPRHARAPAASPGPAPPAHRGRGAAPEPVRRRPAAGTPALAARRALVRLVAVGGELEARLAGPGPGGLDAR